MFNIDQPQTGLGPCFTSKRQGSCWSLGDKGKLWRCAVISCTVHTTNYYYEYLVPHAFLPICKCQYWTTVHTYSVQPGMQVQMKLCSWPPHLTRNYTAHINMEIAIFEFSPSLLFEFGLCLCASSFSSVPCFLPWLPYLPTWLGHCPPTNTLVSLLSLWCSIWWLSIKALFYHKIFLLKDCKKGDHWLNYNIFAAFSKSLYPVPLCPTWSCLI